ncbi:MAG: hypothetical protein EOP09_14835, partial [Proteobacteria bacterium]
MMYKHSVVLITALLLVSASANADVAVESTAQNRESQVVRLWNSSQNIALGEVSGLKKTQGRETFQFSLSQIFKGDLPNHSKIQVKSPQIPKPSEIKGSGPAFESLTAGRTYLLFFDNAQAAIKCGVGEKPGPVTPPDWQLIKQSLWSGHLASTQPRDFGFLNQGGKRVHSPETDPTLRTLKILSTLQEKALDTPERTMAIHLVAKNLEGAAWINYLAPLPPDVRSRIFVEVIESDQPMDHDYQFETVRKALEWKIKGSLHENR